MSRRCSSKQAVFRRALQELHEESKGDLPTIFKQSVDILRDRGLHTPGLFLGQADTRKVRLLERSWDQGQNPLKVAKVQDCYAVADSLLLWLRSLPGPVIPCKLFRSFLRVQHCSSQSESLSQLHFLFRQMDDCELNLLVPLLEFLHKYQAVQRTIGFMNPTLGQVFGPVLLRAQKGPLPLPFPEDVRAAAHLVDCMITDYPAIFSHPPPCSIAAHKPPARARRQSGSLKRQMAAELYARELPQSNATRNSAGKFAAKAAAPREAWPGKHLRVVVVPPYDEAEVCFMDSDDDGVPKFGALDRHEIPSCMSRSLDSDDHFQHRRLATVPEGCPLGMESQNQDPDLDNLVGELLCGSMESMLFENDDNAFLARTGSLLSCPSISPKTSGCGHSTSTSGENTDLSSDEDMLDGSDSPLSTPTSLHNTSQPVNFRCNNDLRAWISIRQ